MANVRLVSGLYRGTLSNGTEQIELRVEAEDSSETSRLSGDLFKLNGNKRAYSSSFIVDAAVPVAGLSQWTCEGPAAFSVNPPRATRVRVIPESQFVTLHFLVNGTVGTPIRCKRISRFWRSIHLKEAYEEGLNRFIEYPTPQRSLKIADVFRKAGIQVKSPDPPKSIGQAGKIWTDAELHAAMTTSFAGTADAKRWRVWLFHAGAYEKDTALGMMFDQQGRERQGCAVFYRMIGGGEPADRRKQLHTCVHEIGHCFNLYHTFTTSPIPPHLPERPGSRSWMNYPWKFPGGEDRFWERFQFSFDDGELVHLRHGFRNDVIMGGRPFEGNGDLHERPGGEASALELRLEGPKVVRYAEPVWMELRLSTKDGRPREVHSCLHPREGYVKVTIRDGGGKKVIFEPLVRRCTDRRCVTSNTPCYESVLLGYGKGGFYFKQPGDYEIKAEYQALDGSSVASNILILSVSEPRDDADRAVAKLWFGDEQGMLLAFRGSDELKAGNANLDEILQSHGDHPLASYARLVQGTNLAREFKHVEPRGRVKLRPRKLEAAQERLQPVVAEFVSGRSRINNLTFSRVFRRLAEGQVEAGDQTGAGATLTELEQNLVGRREKVEAKPFQPHVIEAIHREADEILAKT